MPFTLAFDRLADRVGAKPALFVTLGVYALVTLVSYRMRTAADFFLLSFLVATVQGGCQALSRSLFATLVPPERTSEFFGFFGVFEKFGGVLGPALFASAIGATGSGRQAILGLLGFFVLGAVLLSFVDVKRGQRHAAGLE
jgi:UMF1 family MFS transporter